jgi:hypothetical protein
MSTDLTQTLANLTLQLNRIVPIFQLILGTFGNIINILIFTRRTLRSNACSIYFLALSINNLFALYVALLTRLLSSGWQIDPSNTYNILCKLRIFFVYISLCLIQWFIVLASIDRFLSSSQTVRYRNLSSVSNARKATVFMIIFITLAHFHVLVWWSTGDVGTTSICNIFDPIYDISFSLFYIFFTCLIPPTLMIIFGLKTILNVRKLRSQVAPQSDNTRNERLRSKDRQMIKMLLFQVVLTIICTTPFTAINVYSTINDNIEITPLDPSATAIYNFSANVCRLLNYFNPVTAFYIYTLTGRTFRIEMKHIFKKFFVVTGLVRCLPTNIRAMFEQDQTVTNNQSMSLTKTRGTAPKAQNTKHPTKNESGKQLQLSNSAYREEFQCESFVTK